MLARFTTGQKIVLALTVVALVLGLCIGTGIGRGKSGADAESEVKYTLADAASVPITVHVVGAVQRPGLYTLRAGSRVRDAVQMAGGFTARADTESVNLAAFVDDGEQIRVEAEPAPEPPPSAAATTPRPQPQPRPQDPDETAARPSAPSYLPPRRPSAAVKSAPRSNLPEFARAPTAQRVRINRAGLEELQRIPGVGPELAKNILYHRSMNGPFRSFAELDDVPGIGPATIEKIRVSATLD